MGDIKHFNQQKQEMAAPTSLPTLLDSLQASLSDVTTSVPDPASLIPAQHGISLLDTKNELFLSYLQNLVFLIVLKIRNLSNPIDPSSDQLKEDVTRKLVELRIYLERGLRPLEGKLKYQLDKLLAAASEADAAKESARKRKSEDGTKEDDFGSNYEETPPQISELSYRPNPAAFIRPAVSARDVHAESDGIYRPPRIAPTALPTTDRNTQRLKRPRKSAMVDDFIREELTDAPLAEPSIGAGSGLRGKEREKDEERRAYEEQRLVRLPDEKKRKRRVGGGGDDLDGGLGGLRDIDFGELRAKRKRENATGGARVGDAWARRTKQGLYRKRR